MSAVFLSDLARSIFRGRRTAAMSRQELADAQLRKFRSLVAYAAEHSPYYRELITRHTIDIATCRPQVFPVLTKDEVLRHFDDMVTDRRLTKAGIMDFLERSHDPTERYLSRYTIIHTSGSSGTVGYFPYTDRELASGVAHFTRLQRPSMGQTLAYVGAVNGHYAGATLASVAGRIPLVYKQARLFDINQPFNEIIDGLQALQPTSLGGYAFALRKLAEAQAAGELHIAPRIVQSGGEPLAGRDKAYIERVFGVPVVNVYASSEHLIMGIGRDDYDGMYLMEDDLVIEPDDDCTYVTNLFNRTLPLIRYRMPDRLRKVDDPRPLLPFTKVEAIVGRNENVPVFINDDGQEDFISPLVLVEFYVKGIEAFQFEVIGKHKLILRACLDKQLSAVERKQAIDKARQHLLQLLHQKHMDHVELSVEVTDKLWADPRTGKFRLVVVREA